jgi:CDP-diacylglycerol--glycerol-3-phosphate 3-phosphatidyltransferase
MIDNAEDRIGICTLLWSFGGPSKEIVTIFKRKLAENPDLKFQIIMDYNRSLRWQPNACMTPFDLFNDLKKEFPRDNMDVGLFQVPIKRETYGKDILEGFREIAGVQHCKTTVIDNDVMITSSNHGTTYYRNRKDRWWIVRDCKPLADYYTDFNNMMLENAYTVDEEHNLRL